MTVEILTAPDGSKYYMAPHELQEEYTIRVRTDGAFFSVSCDQVIGLHLGGPDLTKCLERFERSVLKLRELNADTCGAEFPLTTKPY